MLRNERQTDDNILSQLTKPFCAELATNPEHRLIFWGDEQPPDALTFHVSRSSYYARGTFIKNNCRIIFPEILILDRFTTTSELCGRAEAPISRLGSGRRDPQDVYRLVSLVVHFGTHTSGHYITFRRIPGLGQWIKVSDEDVMACSVAEVLAANPTMLMYERLGHEDMVGKSK